MRARRYTILIADRSSGVVRRVTISLRPTLAVVSGILMLPVLIGLGAKWSARAEIDEVRGSNTILQEENGSYRAATGALTTQIQSLEGVINELGARATLDPAQARAMQKLPAVVKARAAGGSQRRERRGPRRRAPHRVDVPGGYVRRPARPARRSREPPAERAHAGRAARKAGRGDPVDLADPRLADRLRSAGAAIRSPASRDFIRASTSRPTKASRSTRRPTARSSRRPTPATTAT